MSYILDALKKSEDERARDQGAVPDIKSIHDRYGTIEAGQNNMWPYYIAIGVLLLIISLFVVWQTLFSTTEHEDDKSTVLAQINAPVAETNTSGNNNAAVGEESKIQNSTSLSKENKKSKPIPTKKLPKAAQPQASQRVVFATEPLDELETNSGARSGHSDNMKIISDRVYKVAELPINIRKSVPPITFSGHVFSSTPNNRSVMINGIKMREGQSVTSDLLLHEITQDGAIFQYNGYLFSLGALQDWAFK